MVSSSTTNPQGDSAPHEPIAIVGIGCRFPGGIRDPHTFWRSLLDGVDAITEIPSSRFDLGRFYDAHPGTPGKVMTRWGGFLDDIDRFDPYFFGISPREADRLDPQQRLLLEVAWEALEDAGQAPQDPKLQDTGVFVGAWTHDYESVLFHDPDKVDFYMTTGSGSYAAAGRLSYFFGFQGPSLTIDTACSSSLVAVHMACQSLRNDECGLALAGGVTLILQPQITIGYSQSRMMAPDGHCKFGDARGDGYVRSEGVGVVVLKRLADALRDGDPIYALIRGSAVNNDGRSSGMLATPGQGGQEDMLRRAYRAAGVAPRAVQYVEAHGTGTRAGDPVEIQALGAVLGEGRSPGDILRIGSVKTNLGHTEAAAGVAGLIKVALALKHRMLPASLHFETPNPAIPWDDLPLRVQSQATPWPDHQGPALAGVTALGIAGTNAHAVLEEAPLLELAANTSNEGASTAPQAHLLPLSAHTEEALAELVRRYRSLLQSVDAPTLADLCYTASVRRTHHSHRAAFVAVSPQELAAQLADYSSEGSQAADGEPRKVAFVFPGQGSQWLGMGRSLLAAEPVFRTALEACDRALRLHADWSLLEELAAPAEESRLEEIGVVQPILFAIQVALAALWRSWGVEPQAVIGHSLGEVAAAHVAGALSLEEAAQIICVRSQLMQEISGQGAMLVVDLSLAEAQAAIAGYENVSVAVNNSSRSTVLSGDPSALQMLERSLLAEERFCRFVKVDVAAHSPQMEPLRTRLEAALAALQPAPANVPMISTVTGTRLEGAALDAAYWGQNLRQPVLFAAALQAALADGCNSFVEISPHPVLTTAIEQGFAQALEPGDAPRTLAALASCRRNEDELSSLLRSLGELYVLGYGMDWARLHSHGGNCVSLPTYPWQRERFWYDNIEGFTNDYGEMETVHHLSIAPQHLDRAALPKEWLWQLAWQPQAQQSVPLAGSGAGAWLILADTGGLGQELATCVRQNGGEAIVVHPGERFTQFSAQEFSVNPGRAADMEELFAALFGEHQPTCRTVIHLWGLNSVDTAPHNSAEGPIAAQEAGIASALHLVQAAARRNWPQPPKLWFVTRGVQTPYTAPTFEMLQQSPLWGLGRVIGAEYPDLWGGLIDLDPSLAPQEAAAAMWPDLRQPTGEDELVIGADTRFISRLVPLVPPATEQVNWRWRTDASYLITGGLGGLGLLLADWLADQGARRLILLGRTPLPPRAQWSHVDATSKLGQQIVAVRSLEAKGVAVHLAAVDVGDEAQLAAYLAQHEQEGWPPIRGVIHAAAAVRFGLLANLTWPDIAEVLHAKVDGGWLLHKLLPDLDFFVMFSSVASLLGQTGQGNYAAANAFLDALARCRRSLGLPVLSINWAVWSETGIAAWEGSQQVTQRLAQQGVGTIDPPTGFAVLRRLLAMPTVTEAAVLPVSVPTAAALPRLLRDRRVQLAAAPAHEDGVPAPAIGSMRATLLALEPERRRPKLAVYLQQAVGQVLRMSPARVGLGVALGSLGLDSLMALELRNRLEAGLAINLPATFAWNYPTIHELLPYLAARMGLPLATTTPDAPAPAPTVVEENRAAEPDVESIGDLDQLLAGMQNLTDEGVLHLLKTQR